MIKILIIYFGDFLTRFLIWKESGVGYFLVLREIGGKMTKMKLNFRFVKFMSEMF